MKGKFKNYSFWMSVAGAVVLLLNNLGKVFGFSVDNEAFCSIVDGVCGVLVVFGVLTMKPKTESTTEQSGENALAKEDVSEETEDANKNIKDEIE